MKYGLYMPPAGDLADAAVLANLAKDAEQAGWDGFFIWDHISVDWSGRLVDTWVALTAIALKTNHIHFGPMVTPMPRRHPWKLARETATLDNLAPGRLILGVGLGYYPSENLNEPSDNKIRAQLTDEGLEILVGLWSGKPFSYKSNNYSIENAVFLPTPIQTPRIPVWIAAKWPKMAPLKRAAQWDGIYPLSFKNPKEGLSLNEIRDICTSIKKYRTRSTDSFDIVCSGTTLGENLEQDAEMVASFAEAGATWWFENINPWRFGHERSSDRNWPIEKIFERVRIGPPKS